MNTSIYDQSAGSIAQYINNVRQEDLDRIISGILSKTGEQISHQDRRLGRALLQVSNVQKLVDNGFTPLPDWKDALNRYLKEIDY